MTKSQHRGEGPAPLCRHRREPSQTEEADVAVRTSEGKREARRCLPDLWVLGVCTDQSSFKTHNHKVVGLEEGRGQSWVQNGYFGNKGPLGPCAGRGHQQPYPILLPGTLPAGFLNPLVPPAPYALGTLCSKSPEGSQRPRGTLGGPKKNTVVF